LTAFGTGEVLVIDGHGRSDLYTPGAGSSFNPPNGSFATLVHNGDGTWSLTETSQVKRTFSSAGKLTAIADRNNNSLALAYDGSGRLSTITDPGSRTLTLAYNAQSRISSVTDPLSRVVSFGYSGAGDLTSVTDARSKVWAYTYDSSIVCSPKSIRTAVRCSPTSTAVWTG
jgi:YD repeat-containing protein